MIKNLFIFIISVTFLLGISNCKAISSEEKSLNITEQTSKQDQAIAGTPASPEQTAKPEEQQVAKPKERVKIVKGKDGKPEEWHYWVGKIRVKVGYDTNKDGKEDVWQSLDKDGKITKVERDSDFDGKVDIWQYLLNGVLEKVEADTDFDGKIDKVQYYKNGKLAKEEIDSNKNGKMDTFSFFDENG